MDGASDQLPSKMGKSPEKFVTGERSDENAGEKEEKAGDEQPDDDHELGCGAITSTPSKEMEAFRGGMDGSGVVPDS
ncbi:hypothetical protein TMatcc_006166 [Talaromyces marneffei ATCC 18224]